MLLQASMLANTLIGCRGHSQPELDSNTPTIRILNSSSDIPGQSSVEFVCYTCDEWPDVNATGQAQSFIWAKRNHNAVYGVPTKSVLGIHSESGEQIKILHR